LNFYDKQRFWYAGAYVNPRDPKFTYHFGIDQVDTGQYDKITTTAYACGCSLFVTRAAIEKGGLMDEIFFCYTEECDWNYSVREKGFKTVYFPKAIIYHKVALQTDRNFLRDRKSPFESYLYARNQIIFMLKHFPTSQFLSFFFLHAIRKPMTEFVYSVLKWKPQFFTAQIRAIFMGIFIGLKRRFHQNCVKLMCREWHYLNDMDSTTNSQNANRIK
jgi:GT2 family glycosyltransferase